MLAAEIGFIFSNIEQIITVITDFAIFYGLLLLYGGSADDLYQRLFTWRRCFHGFHELVIVP